ncbi:hypothetical protein [Klebsiella pneumoniae]|uniref:hypothetical protein n=1 Tax=Klebsiella pneumoniae TaxID=573 RepID=UPI00238059D0|nr:hypothetical protein [Klebsiella pneumoniae]MDE4663421.1 hypothetical protein [Klebsiella pneumoniae]MDE4710079.1 hypothetical protein [Klebsiella pneumoniae]
MKTIYKYLPVQYGDKKSPWAGTLKGKILHNIIAVCVFALIYLPRRCLKLPDISGLSGFVE